MKRLTDKRMKGEGFIPVSSKEYKEIVLNEKPTAEQIYKRLLEIEDILGNDYDLDQLKELVQADREGRCEKLPCKEFFSMLGGDVYAIDDDEVLEVLLCGVGYDPDGIDFIDAVYAPGYEDEKGFTFRFSDVGKTIFLTREEAEAALERMEGEEK